MQSGLEKAPSASRQAASLGDYSQAMCCVILEITEELRARCFRSADGLDFTGSLWGCPRAPRAAPSSGAASAALRPGIRSAGRGDFCGPSAMSWLSDCRWWWGLTPSQGRGRTGRGQEEPDFCGAPLRLPSPTDGPLLTLVDVGSGARALIIMTHKSWLAPPVCRVSAHNNYIGCVYTLSWHGLFITSGRQHGTAGLAEPQRVVFPGRREKATQIPSARGQVVLLGLDVSQEPVGHGRA